MIFGLPWRFVLAAGFALAFVAAVYFFGAWQYGRGVSSERDRWESAQANISRGTAAASVHIAQQMQQRNTNLSHALAQGSEAIHTASLNDTTNFFLSWAHSDQRLCDAARGCGNQRA